MIRIASQNFVIPANSELDIYACDLDHTLISPNDHSQRFIQGVDDWVLLPGVKTRLNKVAQNKQTLIVIFTNQLGVSKGQISRNTLVRRIYNVMDALEVPMVCFAATNRDGYRKPMTGMWNKLCDEVESVGSTLSLTNSIFVGDAAGRIKSKTLKKDFSCSDRLFAQNIGINFTYPELEFQGKVDDRDYVCGKILLKDYWPQTPAEEAIIREIHSKNHAQFRPQEMIINVGYPASGKTYFTRKRFEPYGYIIASNDITHSESRTKNLVRNALSDGKSVVIDNTNMGCKHRQIYLDIAEEFNVVVRIFHFTAPMELCKDHLNYFRAQISVDTDQERQVIPDVAFYTARKAFETPSTSESPLIESIVNVPLLPFDHPAYFYHFV